MQLTKLFNKKSLELVVIRNAIAPESDDIETYQGQDLQTLLRQAFSTPNLPKNVQLYHNGLTPDCRVTPTNADEVIKLLALEGRIYAVVMPLGLDPVSWLIIGVSVLVSVAVALLMPMPQMPNAGNPAPSPNNALAQRSNRQRIGGRIEDIFGEAWAVPSLIAQTYSVYINHQEVEFSFMCVGRGRYKVLKVYDDITPVEQINGTTVQVFNPFNSVNGKPDYQVGTNYTDAEQAYARLVVKRYTAVNGQVLAPPDNGFKSTNLSANSSGIITADGDTNFDGQFEVGGTLIIDDAESLASGNLLKDASGNDVKYNLNGEYKITAINGNAITLDNPQSINNDWQKLIDNVDFTAMSEFTIATRSDGLWQGYFYTDNSDFTHIMLNIVAPNGLYIMGTKNGDWRNSEVEYVVQVQIIDKDDHVLYDDSKNYIIKSRKNDEYSGWTKDDDVRRTASQTQMIAVPPRQNATDKVRFRIRRLTDTIKFKGNPQVQEIRIKDFYTARYMKGFEQSYDATTVYVKQRATEGAMAVKERKLRLLVQRYVRNWQDNDNLILSKQADDIIYHIATDPLIGNMPKDKVDMAQIKAEYDLLRAYFGHDKCSEFCYTFDDNNLSAEETLQTIAQATFCQLYRFDNQLRAYFERPQPVGVAIFNSHNILPDSYSLSKNFGVNKDHDGVTVKYIDPKDDAQVASYYPADQSAIKPDEKTIPGVRNETQAKVHAMRIWHKHLYSYKSIEFTGANESNIVLRSQRIDVADQMRSNVLQGIVEDLQVIDGEIVMTLSNPINISDGTLFIQLINGQVDSMSVTTLNAFQVKLPRMPLHTISTSLDNIVQCTYQLVAHDKVGRDAYIVTEKTASNGVTNKISAINYDERYYLGDKII